LGIFPINDSSFASRRDACSFLPLQTASTPCQRASRWPANIFLAIFRVFLFESWTLFFFFPLIPRKSPSPLVPVCSFLFSAEQGRDIFLAVLPPPWPSIPLLWRRVPFFFPQKPSQGRFLVVLLFNAPSPYRGFMPSFGSSSSLRYYPPFFCDVIAFPSFASKSSVTGSRVFRLPSFFQRVCPFFQ